MFSNFVYVILNMYCIMSFYNVLHVKYICANLYTLINKTAPNKKNIKKNIIHDHTCMLIIHKSLLNHISHKLHRLPASACWAANFGGSFIEGRSLGAAGLESWQPSGEKLPLQRILATYFILLPSYFMLLYFIWFSTTWQPTKPKTVKHPLGLKSLCGPLDHKRWVLERANLQVKAALGVESQLWRWWRPNKNGKTNCNKRPKAGLLVDLFRTLWSSLIQFTDAMFLVVQRPFLLAWTPQHGELQLGPTWRVDTNLYIMLLLSPKTPNEPLSSILWWGETMQPHPGISKVAVVPSPIKCLAAGKSM